jgi:hypothetical protein
LALPRQRAPPDATIPIKGTTMPSTYSRSLVFADIAQALPMFHVEHFAVVRGLIE